MKIFFVKTLYRWVTSGKPSVTDRHFDPEFTLVEERIVMFNARDKDHALDLGAREARSYARHSYFNPYGQRVRTRYLGVAWALELLDALGSGAEVWTSTEALPATISDSEVIKRRVGHEESPTELRRRINILNREFNAVPKAKPGGQADDVPRVRRRKRKSAPTKKSARRKP